MRTTRIVLLTGVAAVVLAGYTGLADAKASQPHVLTIPLPDGQIEQVRYTGDVPPTVILAPAVVPVPGDSFFPFGMPDQMRAAMDRQADALFRAVDATGSSDGLLNGIMPALSGSGICMRSIQITYSGNGQAPHVASKTAGDCASGSEAATPAALPNMTAPRPVPHVVQAKTGTSYRHLIHTISDQR